MTTGYVVIYKLKKDSPWTLTSLVNSRREDCVGLAKYMKDENGWHSAKTMKIVAPYA